MIGFIYKTTNKINGKSYIGMCSSEKRFDTYLGSGKLLKQAITKYGKENFEREVLTECDTDNELRQAEAKWINHYDAINNPNFYNLMEGGRGGHTGFHEDTDMSSVVKQHWSKYTEQEKKERLSNTTFGKYDKSSSNNPMYGRSAVAEQKLRWYTNGEKTIYVTEGTQPEGYRRGRK